MGSWLSTRPKNIFASTQRQARLAQSVERTALNRVVVGSSPTVGVLLFFALPSDIGPRVVQLRYITESWSHNSPHNGSVDKFCTRVDVRGGRDAPVLYFIACF